MSIDLLVTGIGHLTTNSGPPVKDAVVAVGDPVNLDRIGEGVAGDVFPGAERIAVPLHDERRRLEISEVFDP